MGENPDVYFLPRDQTESSRLNDQHEFITDVTGGLIHESIPRDKLSVVADIGTGTGIWLSSVYESLNNEKPTQKLDFHGFDMSDLQFPSTKSESLHFHVHDASKPFADEFIGRFDLVYLRMLVGGINENDYLDVVRNLSSLLKPGGYLQWVDIRVTSHLEGNICDFPEYVRLLQPFLDYMRQNGFCESTPDKIEECCKTAGLDNVKQYKYDVHERPELLPRFLLWHLSALKAVMPTVYLRTGEAKSEADAQALMSAMESRVTELMKEGMRPGCAFGCIIAQKPQ